MSVSSVILYLEAAFDGISVRMGGPCHSAFMRDAEGRQKEASRVKKKLSTPNTCYNYSVGATGLWVHVYTSGSVYSHSLVGNNPPSLIILHFMGYYRNF